MAGESALEDRSKTIIPRDCVGNPDLLPDVLHFLTQMSGFISERILHTDDNVRKNKKLSIFPQKNLKKVLTHPKTCVIITKLSARKAAESETNLENDT